MPFVVKSTLTLEFLGEGWENAYFCYQPLTYNDQSRLDEWRAERSKIIADKKTGEKVNDFLIELVQEKMIEGKGWDGKELVDITKDNVGELPMDFFVRLIEVFGNSPITSKKKDSSGTP